MTKNEEYYNKFELERNNCTQKVLGSDHPKKIIIAGPGTGKSFIFQQVCKKNIECGKSKNVALSFINELVEDLSVDLDGLAEVKTLHGFARSKFNKDKRIFLGLPPIIAEDYEIINGSEIDFDAAFRNPDKFDKELKYYIQRAGFYDHYCPGSLLYLLVKFYEQHPEKIPSLSQLLVDEFQDFNILETKLIDLLAQNSPVLIVGDDDQSLYSWKDAYPEEIRKRSKDQSYEKHELPYCSRCTQVLVDAFNCFVSKAQESGFLKNRAEKQYIYFPTREKDSESSEHNKIFIKTGVNQVSTAFHLDNDIKNNFKPKDPPKILIICPLVSQVGSLSKKLKEKGYNNIITRTNKQPSPFLEAVGLLSENINSNLGWRIIYECLSDKDKLAIAVSKSHNKTGTFASLLSAEERKSIKQLVSIFKKIKTSKIVTSEEQNTLHHLCGSHLFELTKQEINNYLNRILPPKNPYKNFNLRITNILGSKGLSYDYVYLVNFDDKYLVGKEVNDEKICNFLVALTRAKKKVTVFTSQNKVPLFFQWINKEYIEEI